MVLVLVVRVLLCRPWTANVAVFVQEQRVV